VLLKFRFLFSIFVSASFYVRAPAAPLERHERRRHRNAQGH